MATINTNLAGVTSGSQYASAGNNTIYTNLPFNTAGTTDTNVTFFVGASASIDILYNQNFRVDSTTGFHELFGNIEVQGVSSDYTVSSWYGKVVLTHKTSGQVISFQLTKPQNAASNSGVNVEFLDGAIAFTSNVNGQGVWTVWATQGGTDTSTWGAGGLATQVPGTYSPGATPLDLSVASDVGYLNYSVNSSDVSNWTGEATTYTLTTGVDTATAQIFTGIVDGGASTTFTPLDTLTGQSANAADNTLRLLDANTTGGGLTTALITPLGASLTNIGNLQITAADDVGVLSTAGSLFSGVSNVTITNAGAVGSVTAGAGQALTFTNTAAVAADNQVVDGGSSQTVSITGVTLNTAANGTLVTLGGTTSTTGAVNVTVANTSSESNTNPVSAGLITVNGGSSVTINQTFTQVAAINAGQSVTLLQGAVDINGTASTTAVTVNQTAAIGPVAGTSAGVVAGNVAVDDLNAGSSTKAGTIETVTLNNAGAATINSGALTTLNLAGTLTTVGVTLGALTTPVVNALALNLNGATSTGAVTLDTDITTINIASTGTASTLAGLVDASATAVNVSGSAALTITADTLAATATITSTNTAGVTLAQELLVGQTFTGGDGADSILVAATTKTINTGAGNDTVTVSAAPGAGGTVNGGTGTNTLVSNTNGSAWAANANVSNFQTLRVAGAAAEGSHSATGFTALEVGALKSVGAGGTGVIFTTVAAGTGLTYLATTNNVSAYQLANSAGSSDVLNVTLSSAAAIDANTLTAAGIETVNITTVDTDTTAQTDTMTLTAAAATTITVSGNAGLNLTATGSTAVTTFDASGVQGAAANAAALAVTYASLNATRGVAVAITAGSGNDTLTGNISNDTITGGLGNDILAGGQGTDVINGGDGTDTYAATAGQIGGNVEGAGTGTSTGLVINLGSSAVSSATVLAATGQYTAGLTTSVASGSTGYLFAGSLNTNSQVSTTISNVENVTGSTGIDFIVGSAGNNVLAGAAAADVLTGGAGNDTFQIASLAETRNATWAAGDTSALNIDKITDFVATGSVDTINLGGGAAAFGTGITFTTGTTATVTAVTVGTAADFTALAAAVQAASAGVASNSATAQIYDVTVSAGNLAGHYMIVNDNTATIQSADTIVSLTGITGALTSSDFTFA